MQIVWSLLVGIVVVVSVSGQMRVESLQGRITPGEVESLISFATQQKPAPNNLGNAWSYGKSGALTRALGVVYSVTGDVRVLDQMVRFCDASILARNDLAAPPVGRRVLWSGGIDPGYPNDVSKQPIATSGADGDAAGPAAYCARLILTEGKPLWDKKVAIGDDAHFGATYVERAKTYVKQSDYAMDHNILKRLLDVSRDGRMYFAKDSTYKGGQPVPWNQQVMFTYAWTSLEIAHRVLQDDAGRSAKYHSLVQAAVEWFFHGGGSKVYKDLVGNHARDWGYAAGTRDEDATHAQMDFAGYESLFETGLYGITRAEMTQLADTFVDVMTLKDGSYAGYVDGSSGDTKHAAPTDHLRSGDLYLAQYRPDAWGSMAKNVFGEKRETSNAEVFSRFVYVR